MKWQWANLFLARTLSSYMRKFKRILICKACLDVFLITAYRPFGHRYLHVLIFCHTYFKVKSPALKLCLPPVCEHEWIIYYIKSAKNTKLFVLRRAHFSQERKKVTIYGQKWFFRILHFWRRKKYFSFNNSSRFVSSQGECKRRDLLFLCVLYEKRTQLKSDEWISL